jgi:hypothetical protein
VFGHLLLNFNLAAFGSHTLRPPPDSSLQPDVPEVGGNGVKLLEYLGYARHPGLVNQRVGHFVSAQQLEEFR